MTPFPLVLRRAGVSLVLGLGIALGVTQVSVAHSEVAGTSPGDGEVVSDNPVTVTVTTAQPLLDLGGQGAGFALVVQDAKGLYYGDGCVEVGDSRISMVAPLGAPGDYLVTYQYVSADGHSVSGSFTFTFAPDAAGEATEGRNTAPVCGQAEEAGAASDTASASVTGSGADGATTEPTGPSPTMSVLVVAGGLALGAVVALLWMKRKKDQS